MGGTNSFYTLKSVIALAVMFFIWSISIEGFAQTAIPDRDSLPSALAFTKELQSEFAKGDSDNASWVRKVFTPQLLSSSTPKSIQDTIISTTLQLQSIHLKNSSGIIGYLRGVSEQLDTGMDSIHWSDWHAQIKAMSENKRWRKKLNKYLEISSKLFKNGSIADEGLSGWHFDGGKMELGIDSLPYVKFTPGSLVCTLNGDTSRIRQTSGVFLPTLSKWKGEGGFVNWEGTIFVDSLQFVELNDYEVKLSGSYFSASPVTFHTNLFDDALEGKLDFKVKASRSIQEQTYPRFESKAEKLELLNIFPNMDFVGGIVVKGSKLSGTSIGDTPGYLKIYNNDTLFVRCFVDEMLFTRDGLSATKSTLSIYLDKDSIYHPSIVVRYDDIGKRLRVIRDEDGVGLQAFSDSYHKIDFQVEAMTWKIGGRTVDLGAIVPSSRAVGIFRSQANFDKQTFDNMTGQALINPLVELGRFVHSNPFSGFYASEYASFLKLSVVQARLILMNLALEGYVTYDERDYWCEWLPKAENHLQCNRLLIDYDVLAFRSEVSNGVNAQLGLVDKTLEIKGLSSLKLSEAQNVVVSPKNGYIKMSENRDFTFGGRVKAGNFEFNGKNFKFNYDDFLIELNAVDEMHIRAEVEGEKGVDGMPKTRLVRNSIDGISGTIELDHPSNRSGWKSDFYTHYPVLNSEKPSYVYYDSQSIHQGAYHRNRFRYALDPFAIDSLDNFMKANMSFTGELLADGIIPDLEVDLILMDDFSLGIETSSPPEGFPLFLGLGTIYADLKLNMNGLQGTGEIEFLTSNLRGEDMVLVPDSAFGNTSEYINSASYEHVPEIFATSTEFALNRNIQSDDPILDVRSDLSRLKCFNDDVLLGGAIHLNKSGMTANGEFEFEDAFLTSKLFNMKEREILADTAYFEITGNDLNALAFETENVNANINFDRRAGEFVSHEGVTEIALPAVRYICEMDRFTWFMDDDQIELENSFSENEELLFSDLADRSHSNFFSVHPGQDSLHFSCTKALYKVEEAVVMCRDVRAMAVADAEIWPDSGNVTIRRDAAMDMLLNSQIYANDVSRYHRFFDSKILVRGRLDYQASGSYIYKDAVGIDWPIFFKNIAVDESYTTYAQGDIEIDQEFYLSPYFEFTGEVTLQANRKELEFEGGTRLAFECDKFRREWIRFNGVIDPVDVAIPVDSVVKEMMMSHLGVGVLLTDDSPFDAYAGFYTKKPDRGDLEIFKPEGNLRFDKSNSRYVVSTDEKFRNPKLPGTLTELPIEGCGVFSSGSTTLPLDLSIIDHTFVGDVWGSESGKIEMRGSLALNMYMSKDLESHLAEQLTNASVATPLDFSSTNYEYALREIAGMEVADNALLELSREGTYKKVPKEVRFTMMLTGLELAYDPFEDAFISTSEIGIATIGDDAVFRTMPGRVELVRGRNRDELRVYFHISEEHWYFFEYDTFLNFETNDMYFMEVWNKLKPKEKVLTHPITEKFIKMQVSRSNLRDDFVDRFRDFE